MKEYVVWRVHDRALDWFVLRGGQYEPLGLTGGAFRSEVFPGLWIDPAALLRGDMRAAIQTITQGTSTPEHAAFVARLQDAAAKPGS